MIKKLIVACRTERLRIGILSRQCIVKQALGKVFLTKTALHRTRLRNLDQEIFSVLIFYKTPRRAVPRLGLCEQSQTEKIEKNFSIFQ
ncbi:TPA: hypothetical protein ACX37R_001644 [Serratia marcescens]